MYIAKEKSIVKILYPVLCVTIINSTHAHGHIEQNPMIALVTVIETQMNSWKIKI